MLSFPVTPPQAQALISVAERAPYGRGEETLVDSSVRACRQIDAAQVTVGGGVWRDTLAQIVAHAATGLGCPPEHTAAHLYKLLVYEAGGFFAAHRDTEKVDGMVATLVLSLPVAGAGGELVISHKQRQTRVDLRTEEPSELAFAAFYADCIHETLPVSAGHRIVLVYLLVLQQGAAADALRTAPDYTAQEARRGCGREQAGVAPGARLQQGRPLVRPLEERGRRGWRRAGTGGATGGPLAARRDSPHRGTRHRSGHRRLHRLGQARELLGDGRGVPFRALARRLGRTGRHEARLRKGSVATGRIGAGRSAGIRRTRRRAGQRDRQRRRRTLSLISPCGTGAVAREGHRANAGARRHRRRCRLRSRRAGAPQGPGGRGRTCTRPRRSAHRRLAGAAARASLPSPWR